MSARMEPPATELTEEFWDATRDRRLVLMWCRSCGRLVHYPREFCPNCFGDDLEYRPASGHGEVYAYTVIHRAQNPSMQDQVPYVVAIVETEEGARMMSNIVNIAPDRVKVGMPVSLTWEGLSDGRNLPLFEPAKEGVS